MVLQQARAIHAANTQISMRTACRLLLEICTSTAKKIKAAFTLRVDKPGTETGYPEEPRTSANCMRRNLPTSNAQKLYRQEKYFGAVFSLQKNIFLLQFSRSGIACGTCHLLRDWL